MSSLEAISLSGDDVSRCGEIFVTSNADKWTFLCSYCRKATNDIGVFICHIRLDHFPLVDNFNPEKSESNHVPNIQDGVLFRCVDKQETEISSIKTETQVDFPTFPDDKEALNVLSDKNSFSMNYSSTEIKEEYITPTDADIIQEGTEQEKELYKTKFYECNTSKTHAETIINDSDMSSIYSVNYDDDDVAIEDYPNVESKNNNRASNSKRGNGATCELCYISFKFKSELDHHLRKMHNQNIPLKCKRCSKVFRSVNGLKNHSKFHDEKNNIRCPICRVHHTQNYFVTHVLSHESNRCFPCQVCGKIYTSNEERVKHWKTHANDMPFECDFCYRRFRKQQYLTHHLKSHFQYDCQFCPTQFNAVESQKPPYACTACEKLPDIKERLQTQISLTKKI